MKLRLPRLKACTTDGCSIPALSRDGKCMRHTVIRNSDTWTITNTSGLKNPFGMEIECSCQDNNIRKLSLAVSGDGSISNYGHEIKILEEANKIGIKAADIARRAKRLGATVDRTCGLHVHTSLPSGLGSSSRDSKEAELFSVIKPIEQEAFSLFTSRRTTYCSPITSRSHFYSHSSWISFSSRFPTIEIRLHGGTLSTGKLYAWSKVCVGLQKLFHDVILDRETETVKRAKNGDFIRLFKKGSVARDYLDARKAANGRGVRYNMELV